MNAEHIKLMFEGINGSTRELLAGTLKEQLGKAIKDVNTYMSVAPSVLSPSPHLVMNAFRKTPLESIRVVIIGQDPFIKPGEATGLCFSVPRSKNLPPSTRNIYECLHYNGLMPHKPEHGDLSHWADQGVLMLNTALTTVIGKSYAHKDAWSKYTDGLIKGISALDRSLIFILLGVPAGEKSSLIDDRHLKLMWGHPSPMNSANRADNPSHFKYCTVFTDANINLVARGEQPICWDPPGDSPNIVVEQIKDFPGKEMYVKMDVMAKNTLYAFTDGGARANGKANCTASWAYVLCGGSSSLGGNSLVCSNSLDGNSDTRVVCDYGLVDPVNIPGKVYKSSNNRGELTAILKALECLLETDTLATNIIIISDSDYSIMGIDARSADGKDNADILLEAKQLLAKLRIKHTVTLQHVRGHKDEPAYPSNEWFYWKYNAVVDKLCQIPF